MEKSNWFVSDDSPEQSRQPGLFKNEFESTDGGYTGVSSKCYLLRGKKDKQSAKGVNNTVQLNYEAFLSALYDPLNVVTREMTQIKYCRTQQQMATMSTLRKCINPLYIKFHLSSNLNTLTPLKIENKFL